MFVSTTRFGTRLSLGLSLVLLSCSPRGLVQKPEEPEDQPSVGGEGPEKTNSQDSDKKGEVIPLSGISLRPLGRFATGLFDEGAAEIVQYDTPYSRVLSLNGATLSIDVLNLSADGSLTPLSSLSVADWFADSSGPNAFEPGDLTSIAVGSAEHIAVSLAAQEKTEAGRVVVLSRETLEPEFIYTVGALPDMVTFSPSGLQILVANEGEASESIDPEGSITIIDLPTPSSPENVTTLSFEDFNVGGSRHDELDLSLLHLSPRANSIAQDLEPEFVSVSPDGSTAFVSLQEANAVAVVDLQTRRIRHVNAMGFKDHGLEANAADFNDKDGISIATHPGVFGMYQPDAIATFEAQGEVFYITANEGDARDAEEARVGDLALTDELAESAPLRLKVSAVKGQILEGENAGSHSRLFAYGSRSVSIWSALGEQVFDSGSAFERHYAENFPEFFNADQEIPAEPDTRSDNKGPEPEGVVVGSAFNRNLAFVGLERAGGIVVYDVTEPRNSQWVGFAAARSNDPELDDLGPEGFAFVPENESPTGTPLLLVGFEVSGSVRVFEVAQAE